MVFPTSPTLSLKERNIRFPPCRGKLKGVGRLEGVGERVAGFWLTPVDCYSVRKVLLVGTKVVIDSRSFAVSSESLPLLAKRESK